MIFKYFFFFQFSYFSSIKTPKLDTKLTSQDFSLFFYPFIFSQTIGHIGFEQNSESIAHNPIFQISECPTMKVGFGSV